MAQQFKLPDGRNVDYLVSGAKDGFPFVWIHGTPGAYLPSPGLPEICEKRGLKMITLSRAGYGGSSRNKGRRLVDAVEDIKALIEHLGVERCIVGGWSGGGQLTPPSHHHKPSGLILQDRPTCLGLRSPVTRLCRRCMRRRSSAFQCPWPGFPRGPRRKQ